MSNASGGSPTGRALIADLQRRSALLHRASNGFQVLALSEGGREMSAEQGSPLRRAAGSAELTRALRSGGGVSGAARAAGGDAHKELEFGGGLWARYHEMKAQAMAEFVERVGTGRAAAAPVDLSGVNPYALLVVPEASSPVRPAPRPSAPPGAERAVPGAVGGVRDAGGGGGRPRAGGEGPTFGGAGRGAAAGGAGVDLEALAGELRAPKDPLAAVRDAKRRASDVVATSNGWEVVVPDGLSLQHGPPRPARPRNLPPARRRGAAAAEVLRQRLEQRRRTARRVRRRAPRPLRPVRQFFFPPVRPVSSSPCFEGSGLREAEFVERFAAPFPPDVRHADRGAVLVMAALAEAGLAGAASASRPAPPAAPLRHPARPPRRRPGGAGGGVRGAGAVATGAGFTIEIPEGMSDEEALEIARERLWQRYASAGAPWHASAPEEPWGPAARAHEAKAGPRLSLLPPRHAASDAARAGAGLRGFIALNGAEAPTAPAHRSGAGWARCAPATPSPPPSAPARLPPPRAVPPGEGGPWVASPSTASPRRKGVSTGGAGGGPGGGAGRTSKPPMIFSRRPFTRHVRGRLLLRLGLPRPLPPASRGGLTAAAPRGGTPAAPRRPPPRPAAG
eukprot:tig00000734_g3756.t1